MAFPFRSPAALHTRQSLLLWIMKDIHIHALMVHVGELVRYKVMLGSPTCKLVSQLAILANSTSHKNYICSESSQMFKIVKTSFMGTDRQPVQYCNVNGPSTSLMFPQIYPQMMLSSFENWIIIQNGYSTFVLNIFCNKICGENIGDNLCYHFVLILNNKAVKPGYK